MRFRQRTSDAKIELQMAPMIDIVFQLLIFFLLSFKISSMEGDFNIKLPAQAPSQGMAVDDQLPPMTLRLTADASGQLTGIKLNDVAFQSFEELHRHVLGMVGTDAASGLLSGAEIELDCDYGLKYENVTAAITAVLGHKSEADGSVVRLIEKIRFAPPRR